MTAYQVKALREASQWALEVHGFVTTVTLGEVTVLAAVAFLDGCGLLHHQTGCYCCGRGDPDAESMAG